MHVARAEDWIVILSVMGFVIALYASAAFILLRPFIAPKQIQPKLGIIGVSILVATAFSFACIGYAYFVEPYQLETTKIQLQLQNLNSKLKVVQISDTHCDGIERLESKVIGEIAQLKPDLILFSGDSVNSLEGVPIFNKFAKQLTKIAPTYAVKGDWDFAFPGEDVLQNSGLHVLNGFEVVTLRNNKLCIVGANSGSSVLNQLVAAPTGIPIIVMFHNPDADIVVQKKTQNVALYVCGHTHGGQIALPFYGALITQSRQGKLYESGLHKLNDTWLYTNRGIGMEGHFPRLRFFAKPEITVFELSGVGKN